MFRFVSLACLALLGTANAEVGWNVDFQFMKNPLPPAQGLGILKTLIPQVNYVKTFNYDPVLLQAIYASGIRNIVVGIPNSDLQSCATSGDAKVPTILQSLQYLYNAGVQLTLAVGNEPTLLTYGTTYSPLVYPALLNFRSTLNNMNMNSVKLTVPFDSGILSTSYPPSQGMLSETNQIAQYVITAGHFLMNDGSPFFVNLYPFFALASDPADISVPYATLQTGLTASDGITYPNMLAAMVAAVRAALLQKDPVGFTAAKLPIVVGETGWPTAGNQFATVANAQTYVNNALATGIPLYLFEAFDELLKSTSSGSGPIGTVEPYWGWMNETGVPKYPINWPGACDAKFPAPPGELVNLDCPAGTLQSWLQSGGCIKDASCDVIYCPGVTKTTVLSTCVQG